MKIEISKHDVDKVIKMYKEKPFTKFTLENMKPIRRVTSLGYYTIKKIILEYNTSKSVRHPN